MHKKNYEFIVKRNERKLKPRTPLVPGGDR